MPRCDCDKVPGPTINKLLKASSNALRRAEDCDVGKHLLKILPVASAEPGGHLFAGKVAIRPAIDEHVRVPPKVIKAAAGARCHSVDLRDRSRVPTRRIQVWHPPIAQQCCAPHRYRTSAGNDKRRPAVLRRRRMDPDAGEVKELAMMINRLSCPQLPYKT